MFPPQIQALHRIPVMACIAVPMAAVGMAYVNVPQDIKQIQPTVRAPTSMNAIKEAATVMQMPAAPTQKARFIAPAYLDFPTSLAMEHSVRSHTMPAVRAGLALKPAEP